MRRKLLIGIGVVIVVLLLVALILPHFIGANQYKPMLESQMKETLGGRNVTIGNVSIALLPGATAQIDGLSSADDPSFSKSPFLTAKQLKVGVNPMPAWSAVLSPSSNRKSLCCVIRPAFWKVPGLRRWSRS